jgi:hypothetical protein
LAFSRRGINFETVGEYLAATAIRAKTIAPFRVGIDTRLRADPRIMVEPPLPANYYPLIAAAIGALNPGARGDDRRTVYERARTILLQQLRSQQPSRTESEITAERLALEQAIHKLEAEAEHARATGRLRKILDELQSVSKADAGELSSEPSASKVDPAAEDGGAK